MAKRPTSRSKAPSKPVRGEKPRSSQIKVRATEPGYEAEVQKDRELKDRFMATQPESPFSEANLPFQGLKYFPLDETWRVTAKFQESSSTEEVWLRTSSDGHASMRKLGTLNFHREGRSVKLSLFHAGPQAGNIAFLPFRDLTSGKETYGPGRYLNLELQASGDYLIDFNQAFNPYCAYTSGYECPFPPVENDLPLEVRAGEKVYDLENNPASPQEAIRLLTVRFRERLAARKSATPSTTGRGDTAAG